MQEELIDLLVHVVVFLGYAVASAVFAGLGALFEYRGYISMNSGETLIAVWIGVLGAVMLAFAYLIVSDKAAGAYGELRAQL